MYVSLCRTIPMTTQHSGLAYVKWVNKLNDKWRRGSNTNWYLFAYSRFTYSHFAYFKLKSDISPTPKKLTCGHQCDVKVNILKLACVFGPCQSDILALSVPRAVVECSAGQPCFGTVKECEVIGCHVAGK